MRKRTKEPGTPCDRLGLNAVQFAQELHKPHIVPFVCTLSNKPSHICIVADGARLQQVPENARIQRKCDYAQLP